MFDINKSDSQIREMLLRVVEDPNVRGKLLGQIKTIRDNTVVEVINSIKAANNSFEDKLLNTLPLIEAE